MANACVIQCDSFGTRPKKMQISQKLFIRFWTCIYDYIPCCMRSMSILLCRSLTSWVRHFLPRDFEYCSLSGNLQQIWDQLDDDELQNGYFQQDGATCHTSNESKTELESFFDDQIILKALWPPRSPDLSPPDFFLWGALKGKAYVNKLRTIQELENNIWREIAAISEDVLQATFANMKRHVQLCLDSGGEHFQHLL